MGVASLLLTFLPSRNSNSGPTPYFITFNSLVFIPAHANSVYCCGLGSSNQISIHDSRATIDGFGQFLIAGIVLGSNLVLWRPRPQHSPICAGVFLEPGRLHKLSAVPTLYGCFQGDLSQLISGRRRPQWFHSFIGSTGARSWWKPLL